MNPLTLILILLAVIFLVILAVLILRTLSYPIESDEVEPIHLPEVDGEDVARRIGLAVQMKTISSADPSQINPQPFEGLRDLLRTLYPQIELQLTRELINQHALLYTWTGSDPTLEPVAFTAHQDVVPADESEGSAWTHPPFAGDLADGYVWGRGTLDCKGSLITILEAVDNLLRAGFKPERTVYLAFGHDEEVSGVNGAKAMASLLASRGVRLSFLLDEGGSVTKGSLPGVGSPVGLIAIGEKGHMSLKLLAKAKDGHASRPPQQTAIGALSLAIATLESNPFPQDLDLAQFMMSFLGKKIPFMQRMQLANTWLFGGAVGRHFASLPSSNALTRTTAAPTIIKAGSVPNVLPSEAEAILNVRILNGESMKEAFERINDLVGDEVVSVLPALGDSLADSHYAEPSPLSEVDAPQYETLANLVKAVFPGVDVAPYIMAGATDARYYSELSDHVYRFSPYFLTEAESETVHGVNERLSFINAARMVGFYQVLIQEVSSKDQGEPEEEEEQEEKEVKPARREAQPRVRPLRRKEAAVPAEPSQEAPAANLPEEAQPMEPLPEDGDEPLKVRSVKNGK